MAPKPSANPSARFLRPVTPSQRLQADHVCTVMEKAAAEQERLGLAAKRPG